MSYSADRFSVLLCFGSDCEFFDYNLGRGGVLGGGEKLLDCFKAQLKGKVSQQPPSECGTSTLLLLFVGVLQHHGVLLPVKCHFFLLYGFKAANTFSRKPLILLNFSQFVYRWLVDLFKVYHRSLEETTYKSGIQLFTSLIKLSVELNFLLKKWETFKIHQRSKSTQSNLKTAY